MGDRTFSFTVSGRGNALQVEHRARERAAAFVGGTAYKIKIHVTEEAIPVTGGDGLIAGDATAECVVTW
jgi:hypothetical protein